MHAHAMKKQGDARTRGGPKVRVALVWHMHQPSYRDPVHGAFVLPWVRLHALRDYLGMLKALAPTPSVHATFNLVPSLVDQLEAYAEDRAPEGELRVGLVPPASLSPDEKAFALRTLFLMSDVLMAPWPRLVELRDLRGPVSEGTSLHARAAVFSEQDLVDLQVLSKLAWFDLDWLANDPDVRALAAKGRGYDEADKARLRARELALLRAIVPAYRAAAEGGQVELSTSPYYHPILPLLADTEAHHEAHPGAPLPRRFRHPEDARDQLSQALLRHAQLFGRAPDGVWPSEGSVSDEVAELAAAAGVRWLASDEGVLERSIGLRLERDEAGLLRRPDVLYVPWVRRTAHGDVRFLFRDRTLSDLIGFAYSRWEPQAAAADLLERLRAIGRLWAASGLPGAPVVPIILDGENAWEHFPDGGRVFLAAFYRGLADDPSLEAVTVAEALASAAARELPRVHAGSWIGADFSVWIGHADDRRAWDALQDARDALAGAWEHASAEGRKVAHEAYRAACGSDWCWWYGDDRSSANDADFDRLFRRHLEVVYTAVGLAPPADLRRPFRTTGPERASWTAPRAHVTPVVDGLASPGEWDGAGLYSAPQAGSMARGGDGVRAVRFAADGGCLYLLVETGTDASETLAGAEAVMGFGAPETLRYRVAAREGVAVVRCERSGPHGFEAAATGARAAAGAVLEVAIPLSEVALDPETAGFHVSVWQSGIEMERHPDGAPLAIPRTEQEGGPDR
jgi:alpha-amylase/alpha-mannosidase (GH57 family)